jgi:zinc protease
LILIFLASNGFAQSNLTDKLPSDPQVKVGKLANGMTYYIRKNGRPEKKIELRLVVNAGSILEDDDQQGLAHFTEHMSCNGTKNFKKNDLVSFLQSIGVKFGADLNAYTSFDETVYILPIPSEKKENIEKGFQKCPNNYSYRWP